MRKIFSFLVLGLTAMLSVAQQVPQPIRFEHLTVTDGLPENSVLCILQDHLGFIWLGTQNGLVRYDGTKLTSFQSNPENPVNFKGRVIGAMMEDENGDIWIGAESLFRFERTTQRFIEYPDKNSNKKHGFPDIQFIHKDKKGYIWTVRNTNNHELLNRFDPKTKDWVYFSNDT
jgi:ligand-binding sensor domain-containing protein